jgi:hypothetical protein
MKDPLLSLALIATSLLGYLEWGQGNSMFLFQGEIDIVRRLFTDPMSVAHPLVLFPLAGQLILLITIFPGVPRRLLTYVGIGCLGLLLGFICFIGAISLNLKIFASTLPCIFVAAYTIRSYRQGSRVNHPSRLR